MKASGKNRKKYNAKSALVVKQLAKTYQVTEAFVRMAINGDRDSDTAEGIKKEYNKLIKALDRVLE